MPAATVAISGSAALNQSALLSLEDGDSKPAEIVSLPWIAPTSVAPASVVNGLAASGLAENGSPVAGDVRNLDQNAEEVILPDVGMVRNAVMQVQVDAKGARNDMAQALLVAKDAVPMRNVAKGVRNTVPVDQNAPALVR